MCCVTRCRWRHSVTWFYIVNTRLDERRRWPVTELPVSNHLTDWPSDRFVIVARLAINVALSPVTTDWGSALPRHAAATADRRPGPLAPVASADSKQTLLWRTWSDSAMRLLLLSALSSSRRVHRDRAPTGLRPLRPGGRPAGRPDIFLSGRRRSMRRIRFRRRRTMTYDVERRLPRWPVSLTDVGKHRDLAPMDGTSTRHYRNKRNYSHQLQSARQHLPDGVHCVFVHVIDPLILTNDPLKPSQRIRDDSFRLMGYTSVLSNSNSGQAD